MLKVKNQEDLITMFFVLFLCFFSVYVVFDNNTLNVLYFGTMVYCFINFLVVRFNKI